MEPQQSKKKLSLTPMKFSTASIKSLMEKRRRNQCVDPTPLWWSCRLTVAIMGFLGFVNVYAMRVNLSVAMVCMINHTALRPPGLDLRTGYVTSNVTVTDTCADAAQDGNSSATVNAGGEFAWSKEKQRLILGSFFWGYMTTQIAGGWLAARFGGKRVYGWFMCTCSLITLLMPVAARADYRFLLVLRFLAGLGEGVTFPAMSILWANWAPPLERSKLGGFSYSGSQVGNVITFPLAGLLCRYGFAGGWPSIFYVLGSCGLLWFLAWMFLIHDSPSEHPRITKQERTYINLSIRGDADASRQASGHVPWLTILRSGPVWGLIITHTCSNWGTYTFLTNIPTYMNEILHFDITQNGMLSSLPYIGFWFCIVASGQLADLARSQGLLNTTQARKIGNTIGMIMPGILVAVVGYITCERKYTAVALLTLGVAMSGFQYGSGWMVNPVDIAPRYSGVIFGLSNTFATVPGFLAPTVIGIITKSGAQEEWQIVFFTGMAIYTLGALAYVLLGSGVTQEWAKDGQPVQQQGETTEPTALLAMTDVQSVADELGDEGEDEEYADPGHHSRRPPCRCRRSLDRYSLDERIDFDAGPRKPLQGEERNSDMDERDGNPKDGPSVQFF